jgi:hypothetical protein
MSNIISLDHERWKRTGNSEALELVATKSKDILKLLKELEKKKLIRPFKNR